MRNELPAIIQNWWTKCCAETWREDFADPDRRAAAFEQLANELRLRGALLHATLACLDAAVTVLSRAIQELWRWSTRQDDAGEDASEPDDPREHVRRLCGQVLADPVVERVPRLRRSAPDEPRPPDLLPQVSAVLARLRALGPHMAGCPAASLESPAARCSRQCQRTRALLDALRRLLPGRLPRP